METEFLGDLEPMLQGKISRGFDRRQVSVRWLSGSFLAAITSVFLVGGALYAAVDGRQQLALPAQAFSLATTETEAPAQVTKGMRPGLQIAMSEPQDSDVMMVSTVVREGNRDVVKLKPFMHVAAPMAAVPRKEYDYPAFDPLQIFSTNDKAEQVISEVDAGQIYGAEVEGELVFQTVDFPLNKGVVSIQSRQTSEEIEEFVRSKAPELTLGTTAYASVSYFDPARFSAVDTLVTVPNQDVTITAENMSVLSRTMPEEYQGILYDERLARVRSDSPVHLVLQGEGLAEEEAKEVENALASDLASDSFKMGDRLRFAFEVQHPARNEDDPGRLMRISVYRGGAHLVSLARSEDGSLIYASEPDPIPQLSTPDQSAPMLARGNMPTIYDAIFRTAMNNKLPEKLAGQLVRIFAFDVDFRGRITPTDELNVFVSIEDNEEVPTEKSEILFASIKLGSVERRYYRFRDPETGRIDYYDETGKSAKQFLLRQPVPNGKFRSPYGWRRHPITGSRKLHTGVDWAAPRGTPIIAAGNGVVEKAGRAGGYGNQIILRHANGYETSYNHQTRFAKGIRPGIRVRQGQIIGYVGSTGLSTGPHLHYEVIVNGNKVDPMRIKLPQGKVFKGRELAAFEAERNRIDALLEKDNEESSRFASR
jgi:murein DD-endopeptidase MepM/ murein hydrolase activator NlpD